VERFISNFAHRLKKLFNAGVLAFDSHCWKAVREKQHWMQPIQTCKVEWEKPEAASVTAAPMFTPGSAAGLGRGTSKGLGRQAE
jgi:hypothetical protein